MNEPPLEEAAKIIGEQQRRGLIHRTPLLRSESLSRLQGGEVYLKLEALQKTGSFKIRGAYYAMYKYIQEGIQEVHNCVCGQPRPRRGLRGAATWSQGGGRHAVDDAVAQGEEDHGLRR